MLITTFLLWICLYVIFSPVLTECAKVKKSTNAEEKMAKGGNKESTTEKVTPSKVSLVSSKPQKNPVKNPAQKVEHKEIKCSNYLKLASTNPTENENQQSTNATKQLKQKKIPADDDPTKCDASSSLLPFTTFKSYENICAELEMPTEMVWLNLKQENEQILKVTNTGKTKQVLKIKCTDNKIFTINPVFSVVDPGKTTNINVTREAASMKPDKIVVCMAAATEADCKDIAGHFKKPTTKIETVDVVQREATSNEIKEIDKSKIKSVKEANPASTGTSQMDKAPGADDDNGYESCPDMTPAELAKIAKEK